jgi:hypothetical protein
MEQYMTEETLKRIMDLESESNNWRESYAEAMRGWGEAQATADRRLELLRRAYALIDNTDLIIPPHLEDVAYNLYKDIEKELSDENL